MDLKKLVENKDLKELEEISKRLSPYEQLLLWLYAFKVGKVKTVESSHISTFIPRQALPALRYIAAVEAGSVSKFIQKLIIEYLESRKE